MRLAIFIAVLAFVGIVSSWKGLGGATSAAPAEQTQSISETAASGSDNEANAGNGAANTAYGATDAANDPAQPGYNLAYSRERGRPARFDEASATSAGFATANSTIAPATPGYAPAAPGYAPANAGYASSNAETDFDKSYASTFLKPAAARPLPQGAPSNSRYNPLPLAARRLSNPYASRESSRLAMQAPPVPNFRQEMSQQTSAKNASNDGSNSLSLDGALNQVDSDWGTAPQMMAPSQPQAQPSHSQSSFGSPAELFSAKNILSSLFGGSPSVQHQQSFKPQMREQPANEQGAQAQALLQRAQDQASQAEADAGRASQGDDRQSAAASAQYHADDAQSAADNAAGITYGATDNAKNYAMQARAAANRAQAAAERARANAAS